MLRTRRRRGLWASLQTAACLLLLSGSGALAAELEFEEYVQRGESARARGDWESVAHQFAQAINHPELPRDAATRSAVHLEYGRALGVICQYGEAEIYLLRAKEIAEKSGSPGFAALNELGSISVAQMKFADAIRYYSQLLPMIESDPRAKASPRVVISAYEKMAAALFATGRAPEAEARKRDADRLRDTRPKPAPPGTITPYGAQCPKA